MKYFEKFDDKKYIKYSSIGGIFKYFDNILTNILQDIIPAGTQYDGFNFVYESHTLERHKYEHKNKYSKISLSPDFEEKRSHALGHLKKWKQLVPKKETWTTQKQHRGQ